MFNPLTRVIKDAHDLIIRCSYRSNLIVPRFSLSWTYSGGLKYMCNCALERLISTPLSVQQAVPFLNADIAKLFRIGVFAPSISYAAYFVN